jgi:hypothetical protein
MLAMPNLRYFKYGWEEDGEEYYYLIKTTHDLSRYTTPELGGEWYNSDDYLRGRIKTYTEIDYDSYVLEAI